MRLDERVTMYSIAEAAEALGVMSRDAMNALLVPQRLTQPQRLVMAGQDVLPDEETRAA